MASKMLKPKICAVCKAECFFSRACAVCGNTLCFECAVKYDLSVSYDAVEKTLHFLCDWKCAKIFQSRKHGLRLTGPKQSNPTSQGGLQNIPVIKCSSQDGGQPGPSSKSSGTPGNNVKSEASLGKSCQKCFKYQPDIRMCRKCEDMYEYYCKDECWKIEDELDPSVEKEPGKWLCYWCVTDSTESVSFQSNKKHFIRLTQDLVADLEVYDEKKVDDEAGSSKGELVTWIKIKPPKDLRLGLTYDVITPGEIAEATAYEDLENYLRKVKEHQTKEKLDASQVMLSVEQQELLHDALFDSGIFAQLDENKPEVIATEDTFSFIEVAEEELNNEPTYSVGEAETIEELQTISREIEEIELITRQAENANEEGDDDPILSKRAKMDQALEAAPNTEAAIMDRIKAVQRALQACEATTNQMSDTTLEDRRLCLEGKVRCLLKIWEDMDTAN